MFSTVTLNALTSAMDGLAARQRAIANNIANVNTPNYRAQKVSFEDALAASVAQGSGIVRPTTELSQSATQLNGNNVNLDTETLANIDTVLRFQFAATAADATFSRARAAIRTN